jgi:hypothetical protein
MRPVIYRRIVGTSGPESRQDQNKISSFHISPTDIYLFYFRAFLIVKL